jgi:guanylate kinase
MPGKALIFSAPSGSGKTTIVHHLLRTFPNVRFSVSATTRPIRPNEVDGRDYHFLTTEQFDQKIQNGELLEWEEVYEGVKYGTLKAEVERLWAHGHVVAFDVDVKGGINLKKTLGKKALAVFIRVKDQDTLRERLKNRKTETPESLELRVKKAAHELTFEGEFDLVLINDKLEDTLSKAEKMVRDFVP